MPIRLVTALVLATVVLCFGRPFAQYFHVEQWEDPIFFAHVAQFRSVTEAFASASAFPGLYRPLSANLFYYFGGKLFHHSMGVYHALLLFMYVCNAVLAVLVCRHLMPRWAAVVTGLVFASRAANTEMVAYATQIQSLLRSCFALIALERFLGVPRRLRTPNRSLVARLLAGYAAIALALLSKEQMVVLPLVLTAALLTKATLIRLELHWRRLILVILGQFVVVGLSLVWMKRFLMIQDSPLWKYDFGPTNVLGNYALYALSFANALINPVLPVCESAE